MSLVLCSVFLRGTVTGVSVHVSVIQNLEVAKAPDRVACSRESCDGPVAIRVPLISPCPARSTVQVLSSALGPTGDSLRL
ncbi:hypothetical protein BD626DRAFT_491968 [Schizophyllum amplum]|uniref:Secreted protein n=1 Tax=Schizophyllum amplum TaxID=97359 RepID=A0A550CI46_9AGAR|nr:hypothetical protein BD626DRAFT_491968 [Auriculariopsis ampla]